MAQRGRKSAASLSVASINQKVRLAPPAGLSELELDVWRATINAKPADWFDKSHLPLLCQYVRHVSYVQIIKAQIDAMEPNWLTDEDGLKRYDRLLAMHEREGRAISSLATRLRLTPQSVYSARKGAGHAPLGRRPWEPEGLVAHQD
jgi:hypothetical protein